MSWRQWIFGAFATLALAACDPPPEPTAEDIAAAALVAHTDDVKPEEVELRQLADTSGGGHRVICGRSNFGGGSYPVPNNYGEFVVVDGKLITSPPRPEIESLAAACLAVIPQGPPMPLAIQ